MQYDRFPLLVLIDSVLSVGSETVASVTKLSLSFGMFSARMWSDAHNTCSRTVIKLLILCNSAQNLEENGTPQYERFDNFKKNGF